MPWEGRRTASDYIHPKKQQRILAQHQGVCHLCLHPGATQVDHVIPWAEWTDQTLSVHDASNLRPAHGTPCPVCGLTCHEDKTKAESARGRARQAAQARAVKRRPEEKHPGAL